MSRSSLHFQLANRILRDKGNRFSRPIVALSVIGVSLGLIVMMIAIGVTSGYKQEIRNKVIAMGSHIRITHYDQNYSYEQVPFEIPSNWTIGRSFDWGYNKPFSCMWFAMDYDGVIYHILELYGCNKTPNEGVKWTPPQVFAEIHRIETEHRWLKDKKIIVAEDNDLNAEIVEEMLGEVRAKVFRAVDGTQCIDMIQKAEPGTYDLILMDVVMSGGISGIEATQKLQEIYPNANVIILTSHERDEEVLAALGSGANAYCLKDIEPYALVNVIREVAKGACWLDPVIAKVALKLFPKPENIRLSASNKLQ